MYVLTWANIHLISFKVYKLNIYFETVIEISSFFLSTINSDNAPFSLLHNISKFIGGFLGKEQWDFTFPLLLQFGQESTRGQYLCARVLRFRPMGS